MMGTLAGTSASSGGFWVQNDNMGTSQIRPGQPINIGGGIAPAPIGDMLNLVKTAQGEFVLTGSGDTLKLLMDYFLQSPEMWLRLAAMKAEIDHDKEGTD
jgi:hypothetical protein